MISPPKASIFWDAEEYDRRRSAIRNQFGAPVEEFEIQFIDGGALDCDLAHAIGLNQANVRRVFSIAEAWDEQDKIAIVLAVGECGYDFTPETESDDFDVDIYRVDGLRELAEQFIDDGLFGDIPERLAPYLDFDAIARDFAADYAEAVIAGGRLVYRCG